MNNLKRSFSTQSIFKNTSKYRICIKKYPDNLTKEILKEFCSQDGNVLQISFSERYKFVSMSSINEMERTIKRLNENGYCAEIAKSRNRNRYTDTATSSCLEKDKKSEKDVGTSAKDEKNIIRRRSFSNQRKNYFHNEKKENAKSNQKKDKTIKENLYEKKEVNQQQKFKQNETNKTNVSDLNKKEEPQITTNNIEELNSTIHSQKAIDFIKSCVLCSQPAHKECGRCGDVYCSIECQRLDWRRHRYICFPMPNLVSPFEKTQNFIPTSTSSNIDYHISQNINNNNYNSKNTVSNAFANPTPILNGQNVDFIQSQFNTFRNLSNHVMQQQLQPQQQLHQQQMHHMNPYNNPVSQYHRHGANIQFKPTCNAPLISTIPLPILTHCDNGNIKPLIQHLKPQKENNSKIVNQINETKSNCVVEKTSAIKLPGKNEFLTPPDSSVAANNQKPMNIINIVPEKSAEKEIGVASSSVTKNNNNSSNNEKEIENIEEKKNKEDNNSVKSEENVENSTAFGIPLGKHPENESNVIITAVPKPNLVFVRPCDYNSDTDYISILNKVYNAGKHAKKLQSLPKNSDLVIAETEDEYMRALVLNVINERQIIISLIDRGDVKEVNLNALKEMQADIKTLKKYVHAFILKRIPPQSKLNDKIEDYLEEIIECPKRKMKILYENKDEVELIDESTNLDFNNRILELL